MNDENNVTATQTKLRPEFLFRITDEEVEKGKDNFKLLGLNSKPEVNLDYYDFGKIVNQDKKEYAKFYFLLNADKSLTLGLAISDNNGLQYKNDILYILSGNKFILNSAEFETKKKEFDNFKGVLVDTVSKNDPCDMILYKVDDINNYFTLAKLIEGLGYKIHDLQFDYILFKDFIRKDGTKVDYLKNRESRISFAVKTNFDETAVKKAIPNDIINFYYDAGDLKP
ncbi:hypothetical protein ACQWU4_07880 [Chryseobacterium sp. MIQD13]|uniref:hypothetical protein n=1 Tax=Chryseobacterium sp. MIQD13 TaxID=3422310 RepID=UPI003D29444C